MLIGLVIPTGEHGTLGQLVEQVHTAADAGLQSVWLPHSTGFDALTAIAVAGCDVSSITLGTAITPVHTAHPSRVAAQARTVNAAIDGRLVLGLGVSHKYAVEQRWGLDYEAPAAYAEDYLMVARPLIDGKKVDYDGAHVSAHMALTDEGLGGVPVLLAALQPRMLSLAGRLADGTVTWCCGVQTIRDRIVPTIHAAASEAGRPTPAVVVGLPICVTSDVDAGRVAADAQLSGYERLPVYRAVLEEAGATTPGEVSLVGDEASVRDQLRGLAVAGATTFAAILCGDADARARTLDELSQVAVPAPTVIAGTGLTRHPATVSRQSRPASGTSPRRIRRSLRCSRSRCGADPPRRHQRRASR
jgi:F420-dependent oxidoreductase-like protein